MLNVIEMCNLDEQNPGNPEPQKQSPLLSICYFQIYLPNYNNLQGYRKILFNQKYDLPV